MKKILYTLVLAILGYGAFFNTFVKAACGSGCESGYRCCVVQDTCVPPGSKCENIIPGNSSFIVGIIPGLRFTCEGNADLVVDSHTIKGHSPLSCGITPDSAAPQRVELFDKKFSKDITYILQKSFFYVCSSGKPIYDHQSKTWRCADSEDKKKAIIEKRRTRNK